MNGRSTALDAYDPNRDDYTADLETAHVTSDTLSSDSILIAQLCQQDKQALGVLYDRYGTLVYTLALRMTGNRAAAEAVSLDVFQVCWQSADTFQGSDVGAWLIAITRQHALRTLRANGDQATASTGMLEHKSMFVQSESTHGYAEAHTMHAALSTIPIEQREAIELAYYDGLSSTTIAVRMGEPLSTIKAYLRRGLLALRLELRPGAKELDDTRLG